MCGIAGHWGADDRTVDVGAMTRALAHRGPDAEGRYGSSTAVGELGHRRLSIVDPASGDQPLLAGDGALALVANGEIYNAPRLRPSLARDHAFATRSDSEVILHLYVEHGPEAVRQLDGMFAFAIADRDELVLARDPIGIKPLYYQQDGDALRFASEVKAFPAGSGVVREFPPGTTYSSSAGFSRYYEVPDPDPIEDNPEAHARRVRKTLEQVVLKRLMSDVPVGAFLSGGLDSSVIATIMRPHVDKLHTFSVGTEGSRDLEAARRVARHLGTTHHEYTITRRDVNRHLRDVIYHLESFDQDLVRSAIPTYFTARLAAEHVKVVLTGEGADELFAGYRYYRDIQDLRTLAGELRDSVAALHNLNLQRVDRMTMAHSLEARVPFLDVAMIALGLAIPPSLKQASGRRPEKWILRLAVEDLLPAEVVWRQKEQFDEGSGVVDLLTAALDEGTDRLDVAAYRRRHPGVWLRSAEECGYHRLLLDAFDDPEMVLGTVGRWAADREAA